MNYISAQWIEKVLGKTFTNKKHQEISFSSISIDSREMQTGALFVGVKTPTGHRQTYLPAAAQNGATGAIVEELQPVDIPQIVVSDSIVALQTLAKAKRAEYKGTVIGITGSSGKTSTKELLAHLLGPQTHKTVGNFNNYLGLPITILHARGDEEFWTLEAGISLPGDMNPLAEVAKPDAALLTIIGSAHIEFLKTREGIAEEKGKLLHAVGPKGFVALHASDVVYPALQNLRARVLLLCNTNEKPEESLIKKLPRNYGIFSYSAIDDKNGWNIELYGTRYQTPLWTLGMLRNALLCIALAQSLGVEPQKIQERLLTWPGATLRGEWLKLKESRNNTKIYLDAYNSNPEALLDSLWRFEKMSPLNTPKMYVIGTMAELGEKSDEAHRFCIDKLAINSIGDRDRFCFVGAKAQIMADELKKRTSHGEISIDICNDIEKIKLALAEFDGVCFVKGSHSTNLHKLYDSCSAI
jgi:UDP-N-acetylmuramoyl-tripeptide--D-alanyl-D-alanine ligase